MAFTLHKSIRKVLDKIEQLSLSQDNQATLQAEINKLIFLLYKYENTDFDKTQSFNQLWLWQKIAIRAELYQVAKEARAIIKELNPNVFVKVDSLEAEAANELEAPIVVLDHPLLMVADPVNSPSLYNIDNGKKLELVQGSIAPLVEVVGSEAEFKINPQLLEVSQKTKQYTPSVVIESDDEEEKVVRLQSFENKASSTVKMLTFEGFPMANIQAPLSAAPLTPIITDLSDPVFAGRPYYEGPNFSSGSEADSDTNDDSKLTTKLTTKLDTSIIRIDSRSNQAKIDSKEHRKEKASILATDKLEQGPVVQALLKEHDRLNLKFASTNMISAIFWGSAYQVKATIVMKAINKLGDLTDAKVIAELGNADSDLYKALNIHSSHIFKFSTADYGVPTSYKARALLNIEAAMPAVQAPQAVI